MNHRIMYAGIQYAPLEDYEALQAESEELRTALAESRANDRAAMGYLNQIRQLVGGDDFPDMVRRCEKLRKDADRYRWLCDGNGYFLEHEMLCGFENEKAEADAAIDAAMEGDKP